MIQTEPRRIVHAKQNLKKSSLIILSLLMEQIYLSGILLVRILIQIKEWPRVDFIKVGRKAQIIEIFPSKLGARRKARCRPLKSFSKVGRSAWKGRKKFMKATPIRKVSDMKLGACYSDRIHIKRLPRW